MQIEVGIGPQPIGAPGGPKLRGLYDGTLAVADAHARFQEAVYRGNVYTGANLGGTPVASQAGLSATTPVLSLFNPVTSTVNLVLWTFTYAVTSVNAAQAGIWLAFNQPFIAATGVITGTITTTLGTVVNNKLNTQLAPQGQCSRVSTLAAAPLVLRNVATVQFGTSVAVTLGTGIDQIDGAIIIPPGYTISVQASAATTMTCSFTWEECPINMG